MLWDVLGHLSTRDHLRTIGKSSLDRGLDLATVGAIGNGHVDGGVEALGIEHRLRRDGVEGGQGGAEEAVAAALQAHRADQRERLDSLRADDLQGIADSDVEPFERGLVDCDLTGARWRDALSQYRATEAALTRPRHAQRGPAGGLQRLAVGGEDDSGALQVGLYCGDAGDGSQRVGQRGRHRVAGGGVAELDRTADAEVDAGVELFEQAVERLLEAVGEDERTGHEGDAHHDRERSEDDASLARAGS